MCSCGPRINYKEFIKFNENVPKEILLDVYNYINTNINKINSISENVFDRDNYNFIKQFVDKIIQNKIYDYRYSYSYNEIKIFKLIINEYINFIKNKYLSI